MLIKDRWASDARKLYARARWYARPWLVPIWTNLTGGDVPTVSVHCTADRPLIRSRLANSLLLQHDLLIED